MRRPDETIGLHDWPLVSWMKRYPILKLPIVRGVVALVESLVIGVRALTMSANESLGEEEQELGKKEIGVTLVIAFAFAVGLFFIAPLFLTGLLEQLARQGLLVLAGRGLRARRHLPRLPRHRHPDQGPAPRVRVPRRRAHEHPRARARRRAHRRQRREVQDPAPALRHLVPAHRAGGLASSCSPSWAGRSWYLLILSRIVLIPLIAGISYEIIRFAGRHETNPVVRVVMAPGLALQWMTTKQPDSAQVEVAIAALEKIIELEPQDRPPVKGVEVMA